MAIIGIIPARYGSTRFEGKPLVLINGKPMIEHVYQRASRANLNRVVVATDDERIADCVRSFGGQVVMTAKTHPSGTDRCGEAAQLIQADEQDIIVNIQGDEPYITPEVINSLILLFEQPHIQLATLKSPITSPADIQNPNVVKVVSSLQQKALYFSRFPIPFHRNETLTNNIYYKHIGIYAYRFQVLKKLISLPKSSLEEAEKLEQLRWLENGFELYVAECKYDGFGIDTPDDLHKVPVIH